MSQAQSRNDDADICIVGAGPVGLKLALDLADQGLHVLLIEAGGKSASPPPEEFACEFADSARHHPLDEAQRQGLGGTSAIWGGRCIPFDEQDFAPNPHHPDARWPVRREDIEPFFADACRFLQCGPAEFRRPSNLGMDVLSADNLERWCAKPNIGKLHADALAASERVTLLLNTTVTRISIDPVSGAATGLVATRDGAPVTITARAYVVSGGALETTRLLLASRIHAPAAFGGEQGALGRNYMGHLSGTISRITFLNPQSDREFNYLKGPDNRYARRYLQLDSAARQKHGLMNMAARPELPPLFDPAHRSGMLSLSYLGLAAPVIGPRLLAEPLRSRKLGPRNQPVLPHIGNVLRDPVSSIFTGGKFVKARFIDEGRLPGIFFINPGHTYEFWYHAEQAPSRASSIRIARANGDGAPVGLFVDLRYSARDAESVVETHRLMDERLQAAGVARLDYRTPEAMRTDAVMELAKDGAHQIGTARMSARPGDGVVDADCRVHGASNLFVAGSSVFPTSGHANPTFMAVALAVRLARHLGKAFQTLPDQQRPAA